MSISMKSSDLFRIPYSRSHIEFLLPAGVHATRVEPETPEPEKDAPQAISKALLNPVGTRQLRHLVSPTNKVCIVFTDITRACPDHLLIPALLTELESAGVKDNNITLVCAVGLHRPSTREEKEIKLGTRVVERHRVIDSQSLDSSELVTVGFTFDGIPIQTHRAVAEADLVISTGIVEPHQYAGFSGGFKTVAIGASGEAFISYTHGPDFVTHPHTRLGRVADNRFQEAITHAGQLVKLNFILNVVLDRNHDILQVRAGEPGEVFSELVKFARSIYEVAIPHQYDVAVGGLGFPKDANLYQASRAPTYLHFAPIPVVREGGYLIIPARCEEGAGQGIGEQRFLQAMKEAPDVRTIILNSLQHGYAPGQQRAFMLAKVLENVRVMIVGCDFPELVSACKMIPAPTMQAALDMALNDIGSRAEVLIVPDAIHTLPVIRS